MIKDPILIAKACLGRLSRELRLSCPLANPVSVAIELTNVCNLRCRLCPVGLGLMRRKQKFMDVELFKKIVRSIPKHTCIIASLWGESLLHKDFNEMISYAKYECGISYVWLSTNGNIAKSSQWYLDLVRSGIDNLQVAVDGYDEDTYQMIREKGSLKKVLDFIKGIADAKTALKSKTPEIAVVQIVSAFNENQIGNIKNLVMLLGANKFRTKNVRDFTFNEVPLSDYSPKNPMYRDYDDGHMLKNKSKVRCYGPWNSIYINVEGDITPCCADYNTTIRFDNAGNADPIKIWKSVAFQRFRKALLTNYEEIEVCKKCIEARSEIK